MLIGEANLNHRERRKIAKNIARDYKCKKHGLKLEVHGTRVICPKCAKNEHLAKQRGV